MDSYSRLDADIELEHTPGRILTVMPMSIEIYFNPYCTACGDETLQRGSKVRWIDATTHLEAAARLRITRLPALVTDGRLVAQGPRALERLRECMENGDLA